MTLLRQESISHFNHQLHFSTFSNHSIGLMEIQTSTRVEVWIFLLALIAQSAPAKNNNNWTIYICRKLACRPRRAAQLRVGVESEASLAVERGVKAKFRFRGLKVNDPRLTGGGHSESTIIWSSRSIPAARGDTVSACRRRPPSGPNRVGLEQPLEPLEPLEQRVVIEL